MHDTSMRAAQSEDQEDLAAFDQRVAEHTMTYDELLNDLKAHGKLQAGVQQFC